MSPAGLGQSVPAREATIPVPNDWSHQRMIFSRPGTTEQAARVQKNPRYWQQRYRSQTPAMPVAKSGGALAVAPRKVELRNDWGLPPHRTRRTEGYWAESLGSGGSVGAGNYPAKFSYLGTTANCSDATQPDFVIYSSGLEGSSTQASVVAYDNLYSGCTGPVPSVYWAYNTGGQILTSPVYSLDGTQVAFVQTNAGELGTLVLLKWAASSGVGVGNPTTLTPVSASAYVTCSAPPCMTTALLTDPLDTPANDTTSSAYYDYSDDAAYMGDNHGWLHKFSPVFKGPLAEVKTGGWPVQVNPDDPNILSSPVHDYASGNVFVGDAGGLLYRVNSSGDVTISGQLDFGTGIVESPIVDGTSGLVYVFASSDGSASCTDGAACAAVYQLGNNFAADDTGKEVAVGDSVVYGTMPNPNPLYDGAFDSAYVNSANATGNLYVCGNTGGAPALLRIPITSGKMGEANAAGIFLSTSTANTPCSPMTDVLNPNATGGTTEWIFAGVQASGESAICAGGGCAMSFRNLPWQASTTYTAGQEILDSGLHIEAVETGGTSGLTTPIWSGSTGGPTTDGSVTWLDQGVLTFKTPASWILNHSYRSGATILDPDENIELVTTTGTSGGTIPTFNTAVGGPTSDGTVVWTNLGASATAALPAAGGTSGIILDNTVGSGTLEGASQVYFSTLSDQTTCGTSSSVGCAVQASQSALH